MKKTVTALSLAAILALSASTPARASGGCIRDLIVIRGGPEFIRDIITFFGGPFFADIASGQSACAIPHDF